MKHPLLITFLVSGLLSAAVVLGLSFRNDELARKLAEQTNRETSSTTGKTPDESRPVPSGPSGGSVGQAVDEARLLARRSEGEEGRKVFVKGLPALLDSLRGLSIEDLIEVAEALPESDAKMLVLGLAAEQDPRQIYDDETLTEGMSNRDKLMLLGRSDAAGALAELPPMTQGDPRSPVRSGTLFSQPTLAARVHYATKLLGTDFEAGMSVLREVHEKNGLIPVGQMGTMGVPSLPEGSLPQVIEAMRKPENAGMREGLIEMTVTQSLFEGGVESMASLVSSMDLSKGELDQVINRARQLSILECEPAAMIDWMSSVKPGEVPGAFVEWANRDLKGATEWLDKAEPSPVRDQAIAKFAVKAAKLDAESAREWALEIDEEALREKVLGQVERK